MKLRLVIHTNYHFADEGGLNNLGVEAARPVYFYEDGPLIGAYATPVAMLGFDTLEEQLKSTLGGEVGYSFNTETEWHFNVGLQLGATFFGENENGPAEWKNHFGIKFHFGKWLF